MKNKNIVLLLVCILLASVAVSQNVAINTTGATAHPSAILDVNDTSKGLLVSRVTTTQRDSIQSPAQGLLVYNTDDSCFNYYRGNVWINLCEVGMFNSSCPSGFVSVNGLFSIELDERLPETWFDATRICGDLGARLCRLGEWYYACQSGLILNNMIGNWEWTDEPGTGNTHRVIGNTDCITISNGTPPNSFRCCCGNN